MFVYGFKKIDITLEGQKIINGVVNSNGESKTLTGIYDRFQNPKIKPDGKITPVTELGGGFASPVFKDEYKIDMPFTYDSRALLNDIEEGMVYIKFKLKNTDNLKFTFGPAISWKNSKGVVQQGDALQIQSNVKFHELNKRIGWTFWGFKFRRKTMDTNR